MKYLLDDIKLNLLKFTHHESRVCWAINVGFAF